MSGSTYYTSSIGVVTNRRNSVTTNSITRIGVTRFNFFWPVNLTNTPAPHRLEWVLLEWSYTCSSEMLIDRNNYAANCRWLAYSWRQIIWVQQSEYLCVSQVRLWKFSLLLERQLNFSLFSGNPLGTLACFKFYPLFSKELQVLLFYLSLRSRSCRLQFFETNWQTENSGFSWRWGLLKRLKFRFNWWQSDTSWIFSV